MALKTTTTTTLKTTNTATLKTTFTTTITTTTTTAVTMTLKIILFLFFLTAFLSFTTQETIKPRLNKNNNFSLSFPLTSRSLSPQTSPKFYSSFVALTKPNTGKKAAPWLNYRSKFRYSMALIVSLPIGTPPQTQEMVLDTGSQLSWIQYHKKAAASPKKLGPPTTFFDPSLSSSFCVLPCNHPVCKPWITGFTLPTDCDKSRLCCYSYFNADGTLAEGNLVREKLTFPPSQSTLPLVLGCTKDSSEDKGILEMKVGRLSFGSQAKVSKFSYCVPPRSSGVGFTPTGSFYLGENPNSAGFQYDNLLTFPQSHRMPNLDPLAYTVVLQGIRINGKKLNVPASVSRPDVADESFQGILLETFISNICGWNLISLTREWVSGRLTVLDQRKVVLACLPNVHGQKQLIYLYKIS